MMIHKSKIMQRFSAMDDQCVGRGTKIEQTLMKELETAKRTETRISRSSVAVPEATPLPVMNAVENQSTCIVTANLTDQFISGSVNCACDLLVDKCDLACCCDQDCTSSDLKVFRCTTSVLPEEVCIDSDDVLWTSLTQCSCDDQSLLCIIREQDPTMLEYERQLPISDSDQFGEFLRNSISEDGITFQGQDSIALPTSSYKIDDPILIVQNKTYLGLFTVPGQFNGFQCHDGNPIAYLRDEECSCEKQVSPLALSCTSLSTPWINGDIAVARVPSSLITDELPVVVSSVMCNSTNGELTLCSVPVYENGTCSDALLEVEHIIIHNGSGEIIGVHTNILLGAVAVNQMSYVQKFSVKFQTDQELVKPCVFQRSGNPGYILGQPVLAGSLSDTNSIDITVDSSTWFSVRESNRQCSTGHPTTVVRFLEDLVTTCILSVHVSETEDCDNVRSRAYELLTPSPNQNYVGIFGDSNPLNLSEWVRLINTTVTVPSSVVDQAERVGALCYEVPTFLRVNVLYSRFGDYRNPQSMIAGIELTYYAEDIIFKKLNKLDTVLVLVKTSVTFIDASSPPVQVLQTVSDTVRKLPNDFLYPLFISGATPSATSLPIVLIVCLYTTVFL